MAVRPFEIASATSSGVTLGMSRTHSPRSVAEYAAFTRSWIVVTSSTVRRALGWNHLDLGHVARLRPRISWADQLAGSALIIQGVPNLSVHMPNAGDHEVCSMAMLTCPPSESSLNTRSASATSPIE